MTLLEPTGRVRVEVVVRRSRFIGYGVPAATADEADRKRKQITGEHPDASHLVHAYLVGAPGRETGSLSDAGEPKGTAGRPVMEILRGSGIRNAMIVVVRYFGGVKLGTGGLVHAYGDTARAVLHKMPTRPLVIRERLTVRTDYARHEPLRRALVDFGVEILSEEFDTGVQIDLSVERDSVDEVERLITDLSAGSARIQRYTS